jgi:aldose sugar dehydrogenase
MSDRPQRRRLRPAGYAAIAAACLTVSSAATPAQPHTDADSVQYVVDTVATGLRTPWSLAFLPDGAMLVTEKYGGIRLYRNGARESDTLTGIPHAY